MIGFETVNSGAQLFLNYRCPPMPNGYCKMGLSHGRLHDLRQAPRRVLEPTMIFYQILTNVIYQGLSDMTKSLAKAN